MQTLNLMAGLCVLCFIVAGGTLLLIIGLVWQQYQTASLVFLVSAVAGFILKVKVSDREAKIKWQEEEEYRRYREEIDSQLQEE